MKEKYVKPTVANLNFIPNEAIPAAAIFVTGFRFFGAIPSHKLANLPKRKD